MVERRVEMVNIRGRESRAQPITGNFIQGRIFMRSSILALACAGVLFATAAYADDPMAGTYGNTVTTKSEKTGVTGALMFNQDGTYTAKTVGADGKPVSYDGQWTLKDDGATICLAPKLPPNTPGSTPSCSPLQKHNVGDSWTVTNDQGEAFDVSITAGR
jgi:hypothetical protein